jgi:L-fucose isomerase-like protein
MPGKTTLAVIVGNRGFFPDHLCGEGRAEVLSILEQAGIDVVTLGPEETSASGSVESMSESRKCANLLDQHRKKIDGVLVTLPNFGDERAVANALRWSELNVPVLVHAFADAAGKMTLKDRRDSFCGKMSLCSNLRQYNIPYTLTSQHTLDPRSEAFRADLERFAATCRVVRGLRGMRIGALGARPSAFNTVRYSEKLLEESGISVETLDLYELFGWVEAMKDDQADVQAKLKAIRDYIPVEGVPVEALLKMAKFGAAVDKWVTETELQATAVQCWTAVEEFFGIVPCTCMSMMSNALLPSACEVDVTGAVGMAALQLASGTPSALVDWNNNYEDDPDKAVLFHCSNLPKDLFAESGPKAARMDFQEIIAGAVGKENSFGSIVGRLKASPMTFCRVSTDDQIGLVRAYVGEGELTDDELETFGGYGVVKIPNLQALLRHICENGFEHHVAISASRVAGAVGEALGTYMGWEVYCH